MPQANDDTPARLLEAAGVIFAAKGFQAATVREICGRAGANLAAVHYHFGDKRRLYVEAVRCAQSGGVSGPPSEMPLDGPPQQKLREYIRAMLARLFDETRPAWHTQLLMREMTEPSQPCAEIIRPYVHSNFELLQQILLELLPPGTPQTDRHLAAFSIIGQCLHFKINRPIAALLVDRDELNTYDVTRLADHVARFSLAALGHGRPVCEPLPREEVSS